MKNKVIVKDKDEWSSLANFIGNIIAKYADEIDFDSLPVLGSGKKGRSYVGKKGPQTVGKKRPLMVGSKRPLSFLFTAPI